MTIKWRDALGMSGYVPCPSQPIQPHDVHPHSTSWIQQPTIHIARIQPSSFNLNSRISSFDPHFHLCPLPLPSLPPPNLLSHHPFHPAPARLVPPISWHVFRVVALSQRRPRRQRRLRVVPGDAIADDTRDSDFVTQDQPTLFTSAMYCRSSQMGRGSGRGRGGGCGMGVVMLQRLCGGVW